MKRKAPTSEELLKNMYNNRGKYFDPVQFNKAFDVYIEEQTKDRLLNEKVKLNDLNRIRNNKIPPTQLPLKDLFVNIIEEAFLITSFSQDQYFFINSLS